MTAPSVLARAKNASSTSNSTSFSVTMPTITAGKLLLSVVSANGAVTLSTTSTGWKVHSQASQSTNVTVGLFYKLLAAGGDTLTVSSSASTQFGSSSECVDAGSNAAIFVGPAATGSSTNPNPAAVDTLLARDILFLAVAGHSGTTIDSAAPSGFSNLNAQAGGGSNGAGVSTAEKATTATASQDPGTFTSATSPWVAFTVAIWAAPAWDAAWKTALTGLSSDIDALIVGDSMSAGWTATTSNGSNYLANGKATSWPSVLANTFTAAPASNQNFWGDGGAGAIHGIDGSTTGGATTTLAAWDNLVSLGSGWDGSFQSTGSLHTQLTTAGGSLMGSTGSGTSLSFAPTEAFDSFRVYYVAYTGSPNDTVNIGGSSLGTLTQSSRDGLFADSFTVTRGTHTINVVSGGADGYICGIIPKDSTTPRVNFINGGWYGSSTDDWDWTGTYAEPLKAINMLAPKLTVYALAGNDMLRSLGVTNCLQHSRDIILNCLKSGSVLGFGHPYFDPGQVAEATQLLYTQAVQQACQELGCGWVSMKDQTGWTTYALTSSNGYLGADNIHPNSTGYAAMAEVVRLQVDPVTATNVALTGQAATASRGTLAPIVSAGLTGAAATTGRGVVGANVTIALSGLSATSAFGAFAATVATPLTGQAATATPGILSAGSPVDQALTGQSVTGSSGALSASAAATLSGISATGQGGTLSAGLSATLAGGQATASAGALGPNVVVALTGLFATAQQGALTASAPGAATLTGQAATASGGSLGASVVVALSGLSATAQGGSLVAAPSTALSGQVATASPGALVATNVVALSGQRATASAGSVAAQATVTLTGLFATPAQGLLAVEGTSVPPPPADRMLLIAAEVRYVFVPAEDRSVAVALATRAMAA